VEVTVAKIISFSTPGGSVEIKVLQPGDSISAVSLVDDVVVKVDASLDQMFSMVTSIGNSARIAFAKSPNPPESAEIELGLQFTAKGNVYVVESQGSASIKVKLTYKL
jgi:hypothetical protein